MPYPQFIDRSDGNRIADFNVSSAESLRNSTPIEDDPILRSSQRSLEFARYWVQVDEKRRACSRKFRYDTNKRRMAQFFCQMDIETHPSSINSLIAEPKLDGEDREGALRFVGGYLQQCLERRVDSKVSVYTPDDMHPVRIEFVVSKLMGLALEHFRAGDGSLDLDLASGAFINFASGELRASDLNRGDGLDLNCEPDGPNYLLFVELGLEALRVKAASARSYAKLMPAMICSLDLFFEAYSRDRATRGTVNLTELRPTSFERIDQRRLKDALSEARRLGGQMPRQGNEGELAAYLKEAYESVLHTANVTIGRPDSSSKRDSPRASAHDKQMDNSA